MLRNPWEPRWEPRLKHPTALPSGTPHLMGQLILVHLQSLHSSLDVSLVRVPKIHDNWVTGRSLGEGNQALTLCRYLFSVKNTNMGTSLVFQCLRLALPMGEAHVQTPDQGTRLYKPQSKDPVQPKTNKPKCT